MVMAEPVAPDVGVIGDGEQHLFGNQRRRPYCMGLGNLCRDDHHQFFGVQTVADQSRQITGADHNGRVDAAGFEVDGVDARVDVHQHAGVCLVEI
nr:hypothetical protein [Tanacetum cinerariifolium]